MRAVSFRGRYIIKQNNWAILVGSFLQFCWEEVWLHQHFELEYFLQCAYWGESTKGVNIRAWLLCSVLQTEIWSLLLSKYSIVDPMSNLTLNKTTKYIRHDRKKYPRCTFHLSRNPCFTPSGHCIDYILKLCHDKRMVHVQKPKFVNSEKGIEIDIFSNIAMENKQLPVVKHVKRTNSKRNLKAPSFILPWCPSTRHWGKVCSEIPQLSPDPSQPAVNVENLIIRCEVSHEKNLLLSMTKSLHHLRTSGFPSPPLENGNSAHSSGPSCIRSNGKLPPPFMGISGYPNAKCAEK